MNRVFFILTMLSVNSLYSADQSQLYWYQRFFLPQPQQMTTQVQPVQAQPPVVIKKYSLINCDGCADCCTLICCCPCLTGVAIYAACKK
jgi:hypothetical protein